GLLAGEGLFPADAGVPGQGRAVILLHPFTQLLTLVFNKLAGLGDATIAAAVPEEVGPAQIPLGDHRGGRQAYRPGAVVVVRRPLGITHGTAVIDDQRVIDPEHADAAGVVVEPGAVDVAPVERQVEGGPAAAQVQRQHRADGEGPDLAVALAAVVIGVVVGLELVGVLGGLADVRAPGAGDLVAGLALDVLQGKTGTPADMAEGEGQLVVIGNIQLTELAAGRCAFTGDPGRVLVFPAVADLHLLQRLAQ